MSRSKKWRLEWSFFLEENGRRRYNKICKGCVHPVSYTHLDVYKRQSKASADPDDYDFADEEEYINEDEPEEETEDTK